jgi:hypothetical protein
VTDASIQSLLLVEDDPGFARLLKEMFNDQGSLETEVTHVESMIDAEPRLGRARVDRGSPDRAHLRGAHRPGDGDRLGPVRPR